MPFQRKQMTFVSVLSVFKLHWRGEGGTMSPEYWVELSTCVGVAAALAFFFTHLKKKIKNVNEKKEQKEIKSNSKWS